MSDSASRQKFVCYYRVSTVKQGESGLGLEAQEEAVLRYVRETGGLVVASFTETESGRQAHNRPELQRALDLCRKHKATLLIAKLDRLARSVLFIAGLMESGVQFVAVDQPQHNKFMLHVQAAFAEEEARRISQRTKEALQAAKRRGVDIGATGRLLAAKYKSQACEHAQQYRPAVVSAISAGARTTANIRDYLNSAQIAGPGGGRWHLPSVHRLLHRLNMPLRRIPVRH